MIDKETMHFKQTYDEKDVTVIHLIPPETSIIAEPLLNNSQAIPPLLLLLLECEDRARILDAEFAKTMLDPYQN